MDWFGILEAVRKIAPKEDSTFTVKTLNQKVHFAKTATRNPEQIASAWISKFVKWGYVKRIGNEPNPGHKPLGLYSLTPYGRSLQREVPKFDQLRDLVRQYEAVRGTPKDPPAWKALIDYCDQLDREEFGVD